ncbi:MFS transporter [Segatella copri]|uniref:MFS transporter n=1 Tax=Segatella copri TaxID=165179 RepID=UPI00345FD53E
MTKPSIFRYEGHNYLVPFLIISSLFFMWGFAHGILEVLNPHFQESFHISKAMSALTQAAVYGAYFLMALPAGWIIRKWGYRRGVITGLVLFGIGALMFILGSRINSFYFFVLSLFVIGCGLTCLETSANPYTTVLGHPDKAESRINLSQSLNGIGWIVGPLVGGQLLFSGVNIAIPYALVGIFVLAVALILSRIKLPDPRRAHEADTNEMVEEKPMRVMAFGFGMLTCAILTFVATLIVVVCSGTLSLIAFFALYLGESIMFPTIFSLALRDAGTKTKLASSLLIMTIVGGAIAPVIMGYIADTTGSMAIAFLIPLVCYGVIGTYALSKPSVSLSQREVFSKTYPSFLTLKEGSTSHLGLLPSGKKRETALLGARNRYALRMADHQRSSPYFAGWDRLTIAC